jgi:hypothetical protein
MLLCALRVIVSRTSRVVVLRVCPVLDGEILPQNYTMSNRDESPEKSFQALVLEEYQGSYMFKDAITFNRRAINSSKNALPF